MTEVLPGTRPASDAGVATVSGGAEPPVWTVEHLFESPDSPAVDGALSIARMRAAALADRFGGGLAGLDALALADAIRAYEECIVALQKVSAYAELLLAADGTDRAAAALMARCEDTWGQVAAGAGFFEPALAALDGAALDALMAQAPLAGYRNFLSKVRQHASNRLSDDQEAVLAQLAPVSGDAWQNLAVQLLARIKVVDGEQTISVGRALPHLHAADRTERRHYHRAIHAALRPEIDLRATALAMITRDTSVRAALRHTDWTAQRRLTDQVSLDELDQMLDITEAHRYLVRRFYEAKRVLLGVDELYEYDRYAPIGTPPADVTWSQTCEIVFDAYGRVDPQLASIARNLVSSGCVHARPAPGKRRTAFAHATVPGSRPYVLVNFTGHLRDVLTLAHELGHGIHMVLAGRQPLLAATPPTVLSECVGLFFEAVAVRELLSRPDHAHQRVAILARWLEDQFVAVFHHLALYRFEERLHRDAAAGHPLDGAAIGGHWVTTQEELYGSSVRLTPDFADWWSYVDTLFTAPGSTYGYVYGQLASLQLVDRLTADPAGFGAAFTEMLSAGDTRPPAELLRIIGLDVREPRCWHRSLGVLDRSLNDFLQLVGAAVPAVDALSPPSV
ncbi:MAG: oligoendopeptidase [Micromonosporaceae bacterium]|nr:oligoendopeptidase [Micromonosporaceae bacterium]